MEAIEREEARLTHEAIDNGKGIDFINDKRESGLRR